MKKAPTLFVRKNLQWLMGEKISPYALASATGVPQPTIFRILTGESDDPRTKTLLPLAAHFGVTVADLRDRDLAAFQSDHIAPVAIDTSASVAELSDRQRDWLSLLTYLGSDDITEFSELIRARQERNKRLAEELELHLHSGVGGLLRLDATMPEIKHRGKKQSSQSS